MRFFRVIAVSFIVCITLTATLVAQVSMGGTPISFTRTTRADIHTVTMPPVDVAALLAEDSIEQSKGVPYRFGYPFEVSYNLNNSGTWEVLSDGGRLWRLRIECPGAYSINLIYDSFWLPEGAKFYIYNENRSQIIGAFTHRNNKEHGQFATALVKGDVSILEYYEPANVEKPGIISIQRIVHAYKNLFDRHKAKEALDFGESGSCNNNVNCPEGEPWQDDKRAVAMITTQGGFRLCSGVMVNNVRQDLTPYFLTANHCLGGEQTWVFMFNYESPTCANIDGPTWMTVSGSTLKANNSYSDFALLLLNETPPDSYNVYFAGWAADDIASPSSVGIHHPSGDIKKISFDYDPLTSTAYLGGPGSGNSHWRVGNWEDGTTEPGSSGSPLFNPEHRVVGQLHGGYASCTSITPDWYGKFSKSWNYGGSPSIRLKEWLDPDNTGTLVLDGRDAVGIAITHDPLQDTQDTLNDYEVVCEIVSVAALVPESLLLYYEIASVWYEDTLTTTGGPDEYHGFIPSQAPGTVINYYLYAQNVEGNADTTDIFTFQVIDYGVALDPPLDTALAAVDDTVWYSLTVTNTGVYADDFDLSLNGNSWPTSLWDESGTVPVSSTGTLVMDETFVFQVRVIVPVSVYGDADTVEVEARSTGDPSIFATSTLRTISSGAPLALPFVEDFPSPTIDIGKWVVVSSGVEVNEVGSNEPSAPYSVNFDGDPVGADTIMSQAIDLENQANVMVSYFYQQTGDGESPDANDDLFVEYLDSTGSWQLLQQHFGSDSDMTYFEEIRLSLPGDAFHPGFRLRLRNTATTGPFDDWFVDDIRVDYAPAIAVSPAALTQTLAMGDSTTDALIITNIGAGSLSYSLEVVPSASWLTLSDSVGDLVMAGADTIVCTFNAALLDTGIYNADIVITSNDPDSADNPWTVPVELTVTPEPSYICGDVDGNGIGPNVVDVTYLVNYLFRSGPPPPVMEAADVDGSGGNPNVVDVTYLVDYLFRNGPAPACP